MTGRRKRVRVFCYGPIAVSPRQASPWEDVWLEWHGKPGRTVYRLGPTLCSRRDLASDLMYEGRMAARGGDDAIWWKVESQFSQALLDAVNRHGCAVDDRNPGVPSVYTRADGIDRAEAERMLAHVLEHHHGVRRPKFVWAKVRAAHVVTPVSFGGEGL